MIHLGLGQPDFKTPKHDAAKKALDDGHHGYFFQMNFRM